MRTLLTLTAVLALVGCGSVDSKHPLSGEKTTVLDKDLVGYWLMEPEGGTKAGQVPAVFVVGRHATEENALEFGHLGLGAEDRIEVWRMKVLATEIDGRRYISLWNKEKSTGTGYAFLKYTFDPDSKDRLWLHMPDVAYFARAVLDGELSGTVKGDDEDLARRQVHLNGDTAALRAWIAKQPETAFERAERPLRRLIAPTVHSDDPPEEALPAPPATPR